MSDSLQPHGLYSPWNSPGLNTGVGSRSLLQGIFPTQGWNSGLPHCRWTLYQLSHKGSPRILEWVAYPFSSGSSWPVNRTRVSCAACGFFINWALREAQRQAWGLAYRFQKWLPQWPTPLTGHNCDIQARLDTRQGEPEGIIVPASVLQKARRSGLWVTHGWPIHCVCCIHVHIHGEKKYSQLCLGNKSGLLKAFNIPRCILNLPEGNTVYSVFYSSGYRTSFPKNQFSARRGKNTKITGKCRLIPCDYVFLRRGHQSFL